MNLDEKLKNMEPKDTPLLVIGYILLGMMLLLPATANADDNQVLIDQTGDTLILDVFQLGSANSVDVKLGVTSVKADNLEKIIIYFLVLTVPVINLHLYNKVKTKI